ncbi:AAA family ATPase [Megasphaera sp.]|uniref:AAA family ATPase n=1 Tax=Megasphaera sp. TaxID=2023260 RepID=UPI003FEE5B25
MKEGDGMKWQMPIGVDNFFDIRSKHYYFVDKTDFIRQLIDGHSAVTLITRPRRFGKTLTLSMLEHFFSIEKEAQSRRLFDGLAIEGAGAAYMAHRGQYPVLFLSLKDLKDLTWPQMLQSLSSWISYWFIDHEYLAESPAVNPDLRRRFLALKQQGAGQNEMQLALTLLVKMMHQHFGKPVILLLDEYDAPIQQAWEHGFYTECIAFMKQFLGSVLKGNRDLDFAVLTGVLRVAKKSIFSDLNNLDVCSVMDAAYRDVIGFTPQEVAQMAEDLSMTTALPALKAWYDGYLFGGAEIYNPWSIVSFFRHGDVGDYWVNTSGNGIIREMLRHVTAETETDLLSLLQGRHVTALIREGVIYEDIGRDTDALYTMLLTTGYLTAVSRKRGIGGIRCELVIPNREVQDVYRFEILDKMRGRFSVSRLETMFDDLLSGNGKAFSELLGGYLRDLVSVYDTANKESFYHGFVLGMTALFVSDYIIESNRESGYGRFDLAIIPKDVSRPASSWNSKWLRGKLTWRRRPKRRCSRLKKENT